MTDKITTERETLERAIERMDRARAILTDNNPQPECNWGMLDTSDLRAALAAEPDLQDAGPGLWNVAVPPAPAAVPVAWVNRLDTAAPHCVTDLKYCSVAQHESGAHLKYIPLYTAPPAPAAVPPDCGNTPYDEGPFTISQAEPVAFAAPSADLEATIDALRAALAAQPAKNPLNIALNVSHPDCGKAADAFWGYWRENGETHKHGYYESTWGAINRALRTVGVVEFIPRTKP